MHLVSRGFAAAHCGKAQLSVLLSFSHSPRLSLGESLCGDTPRQDRAHRSVLRQSRKRYFWSSTFSSASTNKSTWSLCKHKGGNNRRTFASLDVPVMIFCVSSAS